MATDPAAIHACHAADCFISPSRRQFLRDSAASVVGALVAVGMSRATALGMPLEPTAGRRHADKTVTYPIPAADGAQIDRTNDVILVRWENAVYAFDLSCPHQNTALKWDDRDHDFQCSKHHSRFRPDGAYIPDTGRATRNMDRFALTREGAQVRVDLDRLIQADTDAAPWAAAVVKLA